MKNSLENIIERFTRLTHSPRGQYAASDETFKELLSRLSDVSVAQNPLSTTGGNVGNTTGKNAGDRFRGTRRWSTAASVAFIVGIGIAIAGVYTFRNSIFTTDSPAEISVPSTTVAQSLVFDNAALGDVVTALSDAYGVEISFSQPSLASYRITATFSTDEPIEDILDAITEVSGLSYHSTGNVYVIEER